MILDKIRAKGFTPRREEGNGRTLQGGCQPFPLSTGVVSGGFLREAVSRRAAWMSREPGPAASKAAEVLRKLPDCINEVAPPGHNQISLENVASRRAAAHTWQN